MAHSSTVTYGGHGVALLTALAERRGPTFTVVDAQRASAASGMAPSYLSVLLHRLVRAGLIGRIKRGTYTLAAGVLGFPEVHPFAVGMALVDPCAVSGWSALNHHGLTEQVPHAVTLTTPRRVVTPAMRGLSGEEASIWKVAGQRFEIVTVVPAHYFGHDEVWLGESRVRICDRERALLDCFALPRRFGGLAEGLGIIAAHLHEIAVGRLVAHALRYGVASVAKRIGFALERAGVKAALIDPLRTLPMRGIRLLDPTKPPRGTRDARWGLRVNFAATRAS